MPGDEFSTVVSGRPLEIPAATWNAMLVAAKAEADRQAGLGREAQRAAPQRTIISVKNSTDGDRARFEVMGLAVPLFTVGDSFKERPAMKGNKPDIAVHFGRIAICLEPIPFLGVGRCCVSGVTVAKCDFTEKWHEWADIKHDSMTSLESRVDPGGAYVLWSPGETGVQWCLVRISNPPPKHFPAKITSAEVIGTTNRYKYGFTEQEKTGALHAGWTDKAAGDGGRSGNAYNLIENIDDAQCVPAQVDEIVWVEEVPYSDGGGDKTTEYWFQYEEYDQDAPSDGDPSDGSPGGPGPGTPGYIDVVVCGGWNRCGQYIVLPQKRIVYDARGNITSITSIANDVIPIYQCESEGEPPSNGGPPSYGSGDSGDFSGPSWSDEPPLGTWYIWHNGAAGEGEWWISKTIGDATDGYCWRKFDGGDTTPNVEGQYGSGPFTSGLATVGDAGGMDVNVSGTLNPDATGCYTFQGWDHLYNGLGTWKRTGGLP